VDWAALEQAVDVQHEGHWGVAVVDRRDVLGVVRSVPRADDVLCLTGVWSPPPHPGDGAAGTDAGSLGRGPCSWSRARGGVRRAVRVVVPGAGAQQSAAARTADAPRLTPSGS